MLPAPYHQCFFDLYESEWVVNHRPDDLWETEFSDCKLQLCDDCYNDLQNPTPDSLKNVIARAQRAFDLYTRTEEERDPQIGEKMLTYYNRHADFNNEQYTPVDKTECETFGCHGWLR